MTSPITLDKYPFYIRQATVHYPELADRYVLIDQVRFIHVPYMTSSYVALFTMTYYDPETATWKPVASKYQYDGHWFMETFSQPFEDPLHLLRQLHLFVMSKVLFNQQPRPIQTVLGLIKRDSQKGQRVERVGGDWVETWDYQHTVYIDNQPENTLTVTPLLRLKVRELINGTYVSLDAVQARGKLLSQHCPLSRQRRVDYELFYLEMIHNQTLWNESPYLSLLTLDIDDIPFPR